MTWTADQERVLAEAAAWIEDPHGEQVRYLAGAAGTGKCLGLGTPVLMFDGTIKCVEDVVVGDVVMGPDSKPRAVCGLGRGRSPLYRVTPTKGDSWVCNIDHLLTLKGTNSKFGLTRDVTVREVLKKDPPDRDWKLCRTGVEFPTAIQAVDAYFIGLWLGDGTADSSSITSMDPEIIAYCQQIAPRYALRCTVIPTKSRAFTINLVGSKGKRDNRLRIETRRCLDEGGDKCIPANYLVADRDQRMALLAGLLDTDGHLMAGTGGFEITTKSCRLRDDILFLTRSLGYAAYSRECRKGIKSIGFVGTYQRISISGDIDRIPCLLPRKQARPRWKNKRVTVTGFRLEPIGVGDYYGFTLDWSSDGRFLLGDFTVTHNTSLIVALGNEAGAVFTSFTAKACSVMARKGCNNPRTLHSLLYTPTEVTDPKTWKRELAFLPHHNSPLHDAELVIVDESSMIDGKLAADLISYGMKILAIGDPYQLPPIGGAGFFTSRKPDWLLTEVHRQAAESGILRLATVVRETGKYSRVRGAYGDEVSVFPWKNLDGDNLAEIIQTNEQIIVGTNAKRHQLNEFTRGVLGFSGLPMVGDKVICKRNDTRQGLQNGALYTVSATHDAGPGWVKLGIIPEGGGLELDVVAHDQMFLSPAGEKILQDMPWSQQKLRQSMTWGYTITAHSSQGSQWRSVCVVDESKKFRKDATKWLYTAITRASDELVLVTT